MKKKQSIILLLTTLFLLVFAYFFRYRLMELSMQQFKDISFIVAEIGPLGSPLTFYGAILSIPTLYFIVKRLSGINDIRQTLLFLGITLVSGIGFWLLRLYYLKGIMDPYALSDEIKNSMPINKLQFEGYCWPGFLCGSIVCLILF